VHVCTFDGDGGGRGEMLLIDNNIDHSYHPALCNVMGDWTALRILSASASADIYYNMIVVCS